MTIAYPEPMGSPAFQAGVIAGRQVQPGEAVTVPDIFMQNGTNGEYVDGLQQGLNEAAAYGQALAAQQAQAAAQAAAVMPQTVTLTPAPQTVTLAPVVPAQAAPAPVAPGVPAVSHVQATGSLLDQMAGMLDTAIAPPVAASNPAVTSPGGFSLLDGIEDDLDKGSGTPFMFVNPGDQIVGYVRYVDEIATDFFDQKAGSPTFGQRKMAMLLDIEDAAGELWTVRGYGAGLDGQLRKEDPKVGDGIAIRFTGMQQGKSPGSVPYKVFNARVRRAVH